MIRSMTGFASAIREVEGHRAEVEVRSVNHRFLKISVKLPGTLGSLEAEVEGRVKKVLRRGSVTVHVRYRDRDGEPRFRLDERSVNAYQQQIRNLYREAGVPEPGPDRLLGLVLPLPGVVTESDAQRQVDAAGELVTATVDEALQLLIHAREQEGEHLATTLRGHAENVRQFVDATEDRARSLPAESRDRLIQRVRRLMQEIDEKAQLEEGDLVREVSLLADRLDVTEEIVRLRGHLERVDAILNEGKEVGRKLDFLIQELHREANTIGSKSSNAELSHVVVDLKAEIERMREQVQNLE